MGDGPGCVGCGAADPSMRLTSDFTTRGVRRQGPLTAPEQVNDTVLRDTLALEGNLPDGQLPAGQLPTSPFALEGPQGAGQGALPAVERDRPIAELGLELPNNPTFEDVYNAIANTQTLGQVERVLWMQAMNDPEAIPPVVDPSTSTIDTINAQVINMPSAQVLEEMRNRSSFETMNELPFTPPSFGFPLFEGGQ